jgi:adenylate cyclase
MYGRLLFLTGKRSRARDQWKRAASAAELLQMPHEQAQAFYRIGNTCGESDPERTPRLEQAAGIFQRLGAVKELAELKRAYPFIMTQRSQT